MIRELTLRRFNDMHCHFRTGELLKEVLPFTMGYCSYAVAMPNTRPRAILVGHDVRNYRDEIEICISRQSSIFDFEPLMTIEIRDNTTPKMIEEAKKAGAVAGKIYPLGVTTNSDEGLRDFFADPIAETFLAMQDLGMLLLLHGELDRGRTLVTNREKVFLPTLFWLAANFPGLKVVLEHVSTKEAVELTKNLGKNIAATITAHHLWTTLNDVLGSGIRPHNMCMPVPKGFDDRDALVAAATSGNPKFFLGSDSAPHPKEKKECAHGACGVFTAPILPSLLAEVFEKADCLDRLEGFTSRFGADFYGLPLCSRKIKLEKKEWTVPAQYGSVVPFKAGEKLQWQWQSV